MTSTSPQPAAQLLLFPERVHELNQTERQLRIGYVPGVMPGKWFTRWHERYDSLCPLQELALAEDSGLAALTTEMDSETGSRPLADMVLLRPEREPQATDQEKYHSITLYHEKMVLVLPTDHVLTLYEDTVPLDQLAEETMLQSPQSVPLWAKISAAHRRQNPKPLPEMRNTQDAIELVAAGAGLLLVPLSLARIYHRKDLTYRTVESLGESPLALVWERRQRSQADEEVLQDFIGICRGRTASSWRGSETRQSARARTTRKKTRAVGPVGRTQQKKAQKATGRKRAGAQKRPRR